MFFLFEEQDNLRIFHLPLRKTVSVFLLLCINIISYSQVIKGTVLEVRTGKPVIATVYFNGTFTGTLSDENGNFELDGSRYFSMPIIVSSIGYYSVTVKDYSDSVRLIVYMKPRIHELGEVLIADKSLARKRKEYMTLFRNVFLGTTYNASQCEITNERVITFNYSSCRDTLRAFASGPIFIINRSLGYKITYYLDNFEYYRVTKSFLYKGNILFTDDIAAGKRDFKIYEKRREEAYLGSRMHFFRSLWLNDLSSQGFTVKAYSGKSLYYKDLVNEENCSDQDAPQGCKKYFNYDANIKVLYFNSLSKVIFLRHNILFDRNGNVDMGLEWEGELLVKRIGDTLPSEYVVSK